MKERYFDKDSYPVEFHEDRPGFTYVRFDDKLFGLIRDWTHTMIGDTLERYTFTPNFYGKQSYHATMEEAEDRAMAYVEAIVVAGLGHLQEGRE